jgi:hypothetical protein
VDSTAGATVADGWAHSDKDYAVGDKRRPHISAVVVNVPTQRFDTSEADDGFTVPLPLWVFSEPDDKQIFRHKECWVECSSPPAEVRHSDIAHRAYQIFERRGSLHGHDGEDWIEAERAARVQAVSG